MIAKDITTTIRDFIKMAAGEIGLDISFTGEGTTKKGFITGIDEKIFTDTIGEQDT